MAITYVASGTFTEADGLIGTTGQNAALPAGVQENDFLIIYSHRNDDIGTFDNLTGWDRQDAICGVESVQADRTTQIYTKFAGSSEGDVTVFHSDADAEQWGTQMYAYRGVDLTTPFDVTPDAAHYTPYSNADSPYTDAFDTITTVTDGAFVICILGMVTNQAVGNEVPTGYTLVENNTVAVARAWIYFHREKASAGLETPGASGSTGIQATEETMNHTFCLRPAIGAAPAFIPWISIY